MSWLDKLVIKTAEENKKAPTPVSTSQEKLTFKLPKVDENVKSFSISDLATKASAPDISEVQSLPSPTIEPEYRAPLVEKVKEPVVMERVPADEAIVLVPKNNKITNIEKKSPDINGNPKERYKNTHDLDFTKLSRGAEELVPDVVAYLKNRAKLERLQSEMAEAKVELEELLESSKGNISELKTISERLLSLSGQFNSDSAKSISQTIAQQLIGRTGEISEAEDAKIQELSANITKKLLEINALSASMRKLGVEAGFSERRTVAEYFEVASKRSVEPNIQNSAAELSKVFYNLSLGDAEVVKEVAETPKGIVEILQILSKQS